MPIKISVENNFLKVEGNDPERIYYERSRVSHELLPTYVQLRYDNNKLAQLDLTTLDSTNTTFTSLVAIVAFLTQVGDGDTGDGTVASGGGGLTQTQAQAAFTAALQAQSQVEFQDILLEDANGVVYISTRQVDEETGTVTFTSRLPNGSTHTPAAPVKVPQTQSATSEALYFRVMVGNGVNTSNGDYISKEITRNSAGSVVGTRWFNITQNVPITGTLPNQLDLKLWNRLIDDAVNGTRTSVDNININTAFVASRVDYRTDFWANIAGTGYVVGDRLERVIFSNGGVLWRNRTTETAITAPTLTNLVTTIGECFVTISVTSTAHAADTTMSSQTFTDSPAITIPTIDGKKANTLYLYRTSVITPSPLFPDASGALYGVYNGVPGTRVPIANGAINRAAQFNIANIGSYARLNKELASLFIRNYNLNVSTFAFQFSYQESFDNPELDNTQDLGYRLLVFENNLTAVSTTVQVAIDVKNVVLQLWCNGATTPVTFTVEQPLGLAGAARIFAVQSLSLPAGSNTGQFQIPYKTRGGTFRITPTGTFINYSYRLIFNEVNA